METVYMVVVILLWVTVMTIFFWKSNIPIKRIEAIGNFFKGFLPRIPFKDIIEAYKRKDE